MKGKQRPQCGGGYDDHRVRSGDKTWPEGWEAPWQIWVWGVTDRCHSLWKTVPWGRIPVCCRHCTKENLLRIWKQVEVSHLQRWPSWWVVYKYMLLMNLGCECLPRDMFWSLLPFSTSPPPTMSFLASSCSLIPNSVFLIGQLLCYLAHFNICESFSLLFYSFIQQILIEYLIITSSRHHGFIRKQENQNPFFRYHF